MITVLIIKKTYNGVKEKFFNIFSMNMKNKLSMEKEII